MPPDMNGRDLRGACRNFVRLRVDQNLVDYMNNPVRKQNIRLDDQCRDAIGADKSAGGIGQEG